MGSSGTNCDALFSCFVNRIGTDHIHVDHSSEFIRLYVLCMCMPMRKESLRTLLKNSIVFSLTNIIMLDVLGSVVVYLLYSNFPVCM